MSNRKDKNSGPRITKFPGCLLGIVALTIAIGGFILAFHSAGILKPPASVTVTLPFIDVATQPSATQPSVSSPRTTPSTTLPIATSLSSTMVGKDGMTLLYVPGGNFTMGSDDVSANEDEKPTHPVYLDAFWIDKTDVTNAMYAKCVQARVCNPPSSTDSASRARYYGNTEFDNYPIIYVSWNDAKTYCVWADRRLPTEAEWEKAARGTDGRKYPWGNNRETDNLSNDKQRVGDTSEVNKYPDGASPYGALDMAGNVLQWTADWYSSTYYANSPTSNPLGPDSGQGRVVRGGAWNYDGANSTYFRQGFDPPTVTRDFLGFRCARSP